MVSSGTENATIVPAGHDRHRLPGGPPVECKVSCTMHAIMDIDNDRQEFSASLTIVCRWKEPFLAGVIPFDRINWDQQWKPGLELENAVGIKTLSNKFELRYIDSDDRDITPYVYQTMKVVATFKEFFELEEFPFDYQALNIWLTADLPKSHVILVTDDTISDRIVTHTFPESNEWTLQPYLIGEEFSPKEKSVDDDAPDPPYYTFTCHVSRHHGYHVWNHALIMAILLVLSFGAFAVDLQSVGFRLVVSMLMLLVSMAHRSSIRGEVPRLSYWSLMAKYGLFEILLQSLIVVENGVVGVASHIIAKNATTSNTTSSSALDDLYAADYCMLAVIFIAACFGHCIFGAVAVNAVKKRQTFLTSEAAHYEARRTEKNKRRSGRNHALSSTRRKPPTESFLVAPGTAGSLPRSVVANGRAAAAGAHLGLPASAGAAAAVAVASTSPRSMQESLNGTAYGLERELLRIARGGVGAAPPPSGVELVETHHSSPRLTAVERDAAAAETGAFSPRRPAAAAAGTLGYFRPAAAAGQIGNGRLSPIVGEERTADSARSGTAHVTYMSARSVLQLQQSQPPSPLSTQDANHGRRRRSKSRASNRVGSSSGGDESRV